MDYGAGRRFDVQFPGIVVLCVEALILDPIRLTFREGLHPVPCPEVFRAIDVSLRQRLRCGSDECKQRVGHGVTETAHLPKPQVRYSRLSISTICDHNAHRSVHPHHPRIPSEIPSKRQRCARDKSKQTHESRSECLGGREKTGTQQV
jgi:hypothetical protein